MRQCRKLDTLRNATGRRLHRLRQVIADSTDISARRFEADVTYVLIDLSNTWANFVRSFYLSCLFRTRTTGNNVVAATTVFADVDTAIGFAVQQFNKRAAPNALGKWSRRDEPPWHDFNTLLTLSAVLGFSNDATIRAAVSLGAPALNYLAPYRNFFAHRNQSTRNTAMGIATTYGIFATKPSLALLARPLKGYRPLILEWIDEIDLVIDYLCQ